METSNRKTCIILEERDQPLIDALESDLFNVYQYQATIMDGRTGKFYFCYCEHLNGDHIIIEQEKILSNSNQKVIHQVNGMFYINWKTYIYASESGWQLLYVNKSVSLGE